MKKPLLVLFLIIALLPISSSYSQEFTDNEQTLGVILSSDLPTIDFDDDGKAVIFGEVENTKNFPVSGIKIWAGFYDKFDNLLETTIGTTIMEVIPPFGKSPYMIKSDTSYSKELQASVNLLGFNSSPEKKQQLILELDTLNVGDKFSLSGTITNNGELNSTNTKIQLISYISFNIPRVLGIATVDLENDIIPGETVNFEFDVNRNCLLTATSFKIVGESQDYSSGLLDITDASFVVLNKFVTVSPISVTDTEGNKITDIAIGSPIKFQSELDFQDICLEESDAQEYVYWIQIKKSLEINGENKSYVEFIGKAEGSINLEQLEIPSVEWMPENDGLYFVETFVWDPNDTPLASNGPLTVFHVN